jgi:hypothetical protein
MKYFQPRIVMQGGGARWLCSAPEVVQGRVFPYPGLPGCAQDDFVIA